ncbi:MAG TPA: DNA modification methylase [Methanofastidiosum sp.]|nr:DNA modification methylase [Methanofastidiosum sp.]
MKNQNLQTIYVNIDDLIKADYNPRKWDEKALNDLKTSIKKFGLVDPIIINSAKNRQNVVIGGHMRIEAAKALGIATIPAVEVNIPDIEKEKELNLRLNKNQGEFDFKLLANFAEDFLTDIGFNSEEIDAIFDWDDDNPELFDLKKELEKLDIKNIEIQKGDIYQLGEHRLMCGDSTVNEDILKLMNGEKADMCLCDPPYILDYLHGKKKHGKPTEGFGYKRDRKYLETDVLPDNFTELWMKNVSEVAKEDFHIIVYENWKNLRVIWSEIEKYWKVKNMIVWHIPNRHQGFSAKYKFFSKHDIAMVGSSYQEEVLNTQPEEELLQNEYLTALYAMSGKPQWEGYEKGKKTQPTDFIEHNASDEKNSGQGVVFGTKPIEILIPYIKVLTKRNDLVIEPFGGSGSTLIACEKLKRRCYLMEKSPVYAEVIKKRWENLTKLSAKKL